MVSLTLAIGTPSFCALTRSMSTKSCGVLAVKGENTCVSPGALRAAPTSSSVGGGQHFRAAALAVLDPHRESAAAGADARHRRWRDDDDERSLNCGQTLAQIGRDRIRGEAFLVALFRILEHREEGRRIARLRSGRARKSRECRNADDARGIQRRFLDLTDDVGGARQRRRARQLRRHNDIAAVLRGNEALRRGGKHPSGAADQRHIQQQHHGRMPDHEIGARRHSHAPAGQNRG